MATEGITLWALGGVAQLSDEPPSPRAEFLIATAGPATSLGLAGAAGIVYAALDPVGSPELAIAAVGWLALINAVLAVFNLLPAYPLDGGRVLHSWLWWRSGDRVAAIRSAARIGRGFGYGLIALGVLEFTSGYWTGLWMVIIGWFLVSAATAESQVGGLRDALADLRVADVMTPRPDLAPDWISAQQLLDDHVMRLRHSSFPVHDRDGNLTGLATLAGIKATPAGERGSTPVSALATPLDDVTVAGPDEPLIDLLSRLPASRNRRALVLADDQRPRSDRLVGIVTPTDVTRALEYAALTTT